MTSKACYLRHHVRGKPTEIILVNLSLDNNVLRYYLHSQYLSENHSEKGFQLLDIDEPTPESGSLAILHTQHGFAFLEALSEDVSVESLGCSFDGISAHTGMKVRPSTNGNIPSTLQLLPGQSIYVGKTTLSLVPEKHSNLPVDSSDLPDSNFENYNHQVSQLSTPYPTAGADSTVMESPMPHRNYESDISTPILDQVTAQAISGREDSKKWPESPLKREVMRTVRDVSEHFHSSSQPDLKKEDGHMADVVIDEPSRSNPQAEVKIEDDDTANAPIAKSLGEGVVVDLEDLEMTRVEVGGKDSEKSGRLLLKSRMHQGDFGGPGDSRSLEKSTPLSPSEGRARPDEELRKSSTSPNPARLKHAPSCIARAQSERGSYTSDRSPFLQVGSGSSPPLEDDVDDTHGRKKARTATVSQKTSDEVSQDSLQSEIAVERRILLPKDRPRSLNQASTALPDPSIDLSGLVHQPKSRTPILSAGSKHVSPKTDPDSKPHPTNRPQSQSSYKSTGQKPQAPLTDQNTVSASPSNPVDHSSSMRSTRSTARDEYNSVLSTDAEKRIVFASSSSASDSKPFLKFLSSKGVKIVKSVHDCSVLCVGKELKKTSKLILAVLLGKDIVTDSWVTDSVKGDDLLSLAPYMARDPEKEVDWGISLDEAIDRGKSGLKVLQDHTILFTPSAKKELGKNGFDELKEIVKYAGAKSVSSTLPKKSPGATTSTVVAGTQSSTEMAKFQMLGWRVYVKDIISLSVLRGKLDLDSNEFLIKEQKGESRKRKR